MLSVSLTFICISSSNKGELRVPEICSLIYSNSLTQHGTGEQDGVVGCGLPSDSWFSPYFVCFTLFNLTQCASSILFYDKSNLLSLQTSTNDLLYQAWNGSYHSPPTFRVSIPGYLCRWPCSLPVRRSRKKCGRQGGLAVKLKHYLAQQRESWPSLGLHVKGLELW